MQNETSITTPPAPSGNQPAAPAAPTGEPGIHAASDTTWPSLKLEAGDLESYMSINDSIHLFEWIALKFYAAVKTTAARTVHAQRIKDEIAQLKAGLEVDGCPDGYVQVGSHCVRNP